MNTKRIDDIDLKRFRQSDPILFSNSLYSFQLLDTAFATTNLYLEGHWMHHFNGAIVNNIPLVKKTRIQTVVGAGFLWIQDSNFNYQEILAGFERTFKLGKRRRMRLGVYGVLAQSSNNGFNTGYKFSIDIIDTWKQDWSF